MHSGDAERHRPSSFRIARAILDRLEDSATGRVLPAEPFTPIPEERVRQAKAAAAISGRVDDTRAPVRRPDGAG